MDLVRFGDATVDRIVALGTDEELDDYAYKVAGCVGEFWTHMCRSHVFPKAPLNDDTLLADGIRFGKGLQLVNILRDLPDDLRQGRCYIPKEQLSKCGLQPQDLLDATKINTFRPLYDRYLRQTEDHLASGWRYTTSLPSAKCVFALPAPGRYLSDWRPSASFTGETYWMATITSKFPIPIPAG